MDSNVTTQSTPALPLEQVFQDFIEVAVLLNMINPGKLFGDSRPLGHDNEIRTPEPWHRFKDEFAWLGDIRKGGGSVTAVAGVMMSGQRTLLLASNYGVKPKVSRHLRDVLQTLQSLARSGAESQSKAQRQILESSVDLSWDKIKNYSDRLSRLITWLSAHSEAPDSEAGRSCLVSAYAGLALTNSTQILHCMMVLQDFMPSRETISQYVKQVMSSQKETSVTVWTKNARSNQRLKYFIGYAIMLVVLDHGTAHQRF